MYETVKSIADEYLDELQKIFDQIEGLLKMVNDLVQQIMNTVEEQVARATEETRRAAEASKRKMEEQINKYKEKLSGLKKVLEGPSYVADKICSGVKSAVSWIKNLFSGKWRKRNACGIPPVIPKLDVNVPDVNLEALKNFIKSLDPDIDLIDFDWGDILPALKHSSIVDIREKLKRILKGFFSLVQDYCSLAKKIFYLSIILIIWDATVYMRGYYSDLSHDNMLVDDNLRELWHSGQKEKITPL